MEQIAQTSPSCWHCKLDVPRNLKPKCKCKDKFLHDYCLTMIANTKDTLYCPFCKDRYPLEIRPESEIDLEICKFFWGIVITIFMTYIIGLIIYLVLLKVLDLLNIQSPFIVKIIGPCIFLWKTYLIGPPIINWSKRIYELCHQWYRSTYEWKLIDDKPSTDNNIEEYNIEEI